MRQDSPRLLRREDHGQLSRALDALDVVDEVQFAGEHLLLKKEQCSKGLVLCRCSNVFLGSQVREELGNLAFAHFVGMTLAMKKNVAPDPIDVRLLGADAVMFHAQTPAHAVE